MPGIRAIGLADWYIVRGDAWDFDGYIRAGGDVNKLIVHWMCEDDKLEPFWNDRIRKIDWIRERGISNVMTIDFSTWGEWPTVERLFNVYRSTVVNRDFSRAGLNLLPTIKPGILREIHALNGHWPDDYPGPFVVDLSHLGNGPVNKKLYTNLKTYIAARWGNPVLWLWARRKAYDWWVSHLGPATWVPTRAHFQTQVLATRKRLRKNASG